MSFSIDLPSRAILAAGCMTDDSPVRTFADKPNLAIAMDVACCGDGCVHQGAAYVLSIQAAAGVIAALWSDAHRQGVAPALHAAIDQANRVLADAWKDHG